MAEYKDLQPTDGANETRTDAVWFENQPPDSVNNAGRANEGMTARYYRDNNGSLQSTGSAGEYTVTLNSIYSALFEGMTFTFLANHDCPASPHITVNAPSPLPRTPLRSTRGQDLSAGAIRQFQIVSVVYSGSDFQIQSNLPVGDQDIDTPNLADKAVTFPKMADQTPGSLFTYDSSGRPKVVTGIDNQVTVRRGGEWVAENMPGDAVITGQIEPLTAGSTDIDTTPLGQEPDLITGRFVCLATDLDYFVGDEVPWQRQDSYQSNRVETSPPVIYNVSGGLNMTYRSNNVSIDILDYVFLPLRQTTSEHAGLRAIDKSKWKFVYEFRVYQSSLPPAAPGIGVDSAYSTISDGVTQVDASGKDTVLFKSSDSSVNVTVAPADKSVDLTVIGGGGGAPTIATYVTTASEGALPNSSLFTVNFDNSLATKTTDDLTPSATRLYVTSAEKTQWNAAQRNTVDSVFGLTGAVKIGTLSLEASPPADGLIALEKNDGTSWNIRVDALTGGAVTAAYANLAGTTGSAIAVGSDTITMIGADAKVTVAVTNDDPTYGDVFRITVDETQFNIGNLAGEITDVSHGSRGGGALHAEANGTTAGFMSAALFTSTNNHITSTANPHSVTKAQVGLGSTEDGAQVNPDIATQAEAEAGTNNTDMMTPLRTAQAIAAQGYTPPTVLTGSATVPSSIPAGRTVPVVITVTGADPLTDAVTFIHVPSTNGNIDRYGVVTFANQVTVYLSNNSTSTISGLTGSVTVKTESIS